MRYGFQEQRNLLVRQALCEPLFGLTKGLANLRIKMRRLIP